MTLAEKVLRAKQDYDEVYDAGKQAGHIDMVKSHQEYGERKDYQYMWAGKWWTEDRIQPQYDIKPTDAYMMFYQNTNIKDLVSLLKSRGVSLDTSECTNLQYTFSSPSITKIGVVDARKVYAFYYPFNGAKQLVEVEKFILKSNGAQTFSGCFDNCESLEKFIVEGVIGKAGFNVKWSKKLNKESLTSIFNTLSTTTSGLTVTLSKTAVNNAFGIDVDDESTYPEGSEYYTLRHSKDNWTVIYSDV